jgi:hypothetical protein
MTAPSFEVRQPAEAHEMWQDSAVLAWGDLERDGLTHRGGTVRMVLATGEVVELRAEPLQKGIISFMAGRSAINDTICRFSWGDRVGVGDFEISNNAAAGLSEPVFAINGVLADGLHLLGSQP